MIGELQPDTTGTQPYRPLLEERLAATATIDNVVSLEEARQRKNVQAHFSQSSAWTGPADPVPEIDEVSPFEKIDQNNDSEVARILARIERSGVPYARRLHRSITRLRDVAKEEYPDQSPLEAPSLRGLWQFMNNENRIAFPKLSLTPWGTIRAQWTVARNQHIGIEFRSQTDAKAIIFAPDPAANSRTLQSSIVVSVAALSDILTPFNLFWMKEENEPRSQSG